MASCILWLWLFVLIALVVPPHLAAQKQDGGSAPTTPRNAIWSWPIVFMHSRIIYLNTTTRTYSGITCIKEYRVTWNRSARFLTKKVVVLSSPEKGVTKDVVYKAVWKRGPAQAFTAVDSSGSANYTIEFQYTSEYCGIIKKQNETGGDHNDGCELWVNDKFFKSEPQDQELCTANFDKYCKRNNARKFNIDDCQSTEGKSILIA
uniref:Putative group iv salivary lipocalin n=1 Tax=Rhipicephalus pulchellus TaxID=72859 RepID=L7M9X5_RHIPC